MKPIVLVAAIFTYIFGACVTYAALHLIDIETKEYVFVAGGILGAQMATFVHHRNPDARNTLRIKTAIGITLAVTGGLIGICLHVLFSPFKYVEVTIPITAIGLSFAIPFFVFNTIWNALSKKSE